MIQVGDIVRFNANEQSCDGVKFCQANNITGVVSEICFGATYALSRLIDQIGNLPSGPQMFVVRTGFDYPIYAKDNELELVVKKEMIPVDEGY